MKAEKIPSSFVLYPTEGRSPGLHLSHLIAYYGRVTGLIKPGTEDDERYRDLQFEKGFLWEEILDEVWSRRHAGRRRKVVTNFLPQPEYCIDGIYLTLDGVDLDAGVTEEYKCSVKSSTQFNEVMFETNFPLWSMQVKAGLYAAGMNQCRFEALFLCGNYRPPFPEPLALMLTYTDYEIKENWDMILRLARSME